MQEENSRQTIKHHQQGLRSALISLSARLDLIQDLTDAFLCTKILLEKVDYPKLCPFIYACNILFFLF